MLSMIGCETTECNQQRNKISQRSMLPTTLYRVHRWLSKDLADKMKPMQTKYFHLSAFNSLLLYFSLDKSYLL